MRAGRNILVIEDNQADVRLMKEAFKLVKPAVTVHVAETGEQAIEFLRRKGPFATAPRPALVFLDFNLPKTNSRELLSEIKQDANLRTVPIAVLTTSEVDRDIREAYDLYANCYLCKPSDLDSFLETVRAAAHFWLNVASSPTGFDDSSN